jgi:hypothetical protein
MARRVFAFDRRIRPANRNWSMFDLGLTLKNLFRAEWLFKPRLIQAIAGLDRQLLSEETPIMFSREPLA